jgi:hypothetical protein
MDGQWALQPRVAVAVFSNRNSDMREPSAGAPLFTLFLVRIDPVSPKTVPVAVNSRVVRNGVRIPELTRSTDAHISYSQTKVANAHCPAHIRLRDRECEVHRSNIVSIVACQWQNMGMREPAL